MDVQKTPKDAADKILLTATETAQLLSLSRSTVYEMMAGDQLPVVRIGRAVRVPLDSLKDWVRSRSSAPCHDSFGDGRGPATRGERE